MTSFLALLGICFVIYLVVKSVAKEIREAVLREDERIRAQATAEEDAKLAKAKEALDAARRKLFQHVYFYELSLAEATKADPTDKHLDIAKAFVSRMEERAGWAETVAEIRSVPEYEDFKITKLEMAMGKWKELEGQEKVMATMRLLYPLPEDIEAVARLKDC